MATQPERLEELEQKVQTLETNSTLVGERLDVVKEKAGEAHKAAQEHTTRIAVLEHRVAVLEKQREDAEPAVMKEQLALLMREREAAISRRWQVGIGILIGIVVGLIVGITLASLGLKK